jgi:hypothetical protein
VSPTNSRAAHFIPSVAPILGVSANATEEIVSAFERYVAELLEQTYIAVLSGRRVTRALRSDPTIVVLASDEFWERVSGITDFRARLIRTTAALSGLIAARAASEVARIRGEAHEIFGDASGNLDLAKLADPPARPRRRRT